LELTPAQQVAARASGLALLPATEEQVARLTVQRRVFRIAGRPFLATRDGGYFETHATLAAQIEAYLPEVAVLAVTPGAPPADVPATPADERSSEEVADIISSAPSDAAQPGVEAERDGAPARVRRPRTRRAKLMPTATEPAGDARSEDGPTAAEVVAAASAAAPIRGLVAERRRAGQPKTPRWMVAGKLRRGRLR
jgi:hypothetical protein